MADEPFYVAQTGERLTDEQRHAWLYAHHQQAKMEGAQAGRVAVHPTIPDLVLFEAWKDRDPDKAEPNWQLQGKAA